MMAWVELSSTSQASRVSTFRYLCNRTGSFRSGDLPRFISPPVAVVGSYVGDGPAEISSRTFWTFAREFSPLRGARGVRETARLISDTLLPLCSWDRPRSGPFILAPSAHDRARPVVGTIVGRRSCGRVEGRAYRAGGRSLGSGPRPNEVRPPEPSSQGVTSCAVRLARWRNLGESVQDAPVYAASRMR